MVITDAELLELEAEMDRIEKEMAKNEKQKEAWYIKQVNNLDKKLSIMTTIEDIKDEIQCGKELAAEIRSIKEAKTVTQERLKDLIKKIRKATAEEDASSSKDGIKLDRMTK